MKSYYIVVDITHKTGEIYKDRSSAARHIGIHSMTLYRAFSSVGYYERGNYFCFRSEVTESERGSSYKSQYNLRKGIELIKQVKQEIDYRKSKSNDYG